MSALCAGYFGAFPDVNVTRTPQLHAAPTNDTMTKA